MKNVISFSLWGDNMMYWKGALENIELAKLFYPGFICRFYIDQSAKSELIQSIQGENVEVVLVDSKDSFHGMFWRFWASEDPEVDIFLSRDTDSRISQREIYAVMEWANSDKDFHIMRDHPYHTVPILGGMWGSRNGIMKKVGLMDKIEEWNQFYRKGIDQDFLGEKIYPLVKDTSFEHSEFGLNFGGQTHPFPTQRENYEFVGEIYNEFNQRHPEHWQLIKLSNR